MLPIIQSKEEALATLRIMTPMMMMMMKQYLLDSQSFQLMGDGCDIISWHKVGPEVPARQKRQESGCPSDTRIMMMM